MYANKKVILATKHKKERAIKPAFESILGCSINVPKNFNTDEFGTFTGEIPREGTPYQTLLLKAKSAAARYGYRYAISSEGSFGPHPTLFFAPGDMELMAFIDIENDLIIYESEISTATNFNSITISQHDSYDDFLEKAQFPSHGLIVQPLDTKDGHIIKDITSKRILQKALAISFSVAKRVKIETDMRAMHNPLRMNVIANLADKLAKRVQSTCPDCQTPGFGKITLHDHLECSQCGNKTELYKHKVLNCLKCDYQLEKPRDDGKTIADPMHCQFCNP